MKLSDAILLGSSGTGQTFGQLWDESKQNTCAMGAAFDAEGIVKTTVLVDSSTMGLWESLQPMSIPLAWRWAYEEQFGHSVKCPACAEEKQAKVDLITHLNDTHRWTRPAIAVYIKQFEPQETKVSVPMVLNSHSLVSTPD